MPITILVTTRAEDGKEWQYRDTSVKVVDATKSLKQLQIPACLQALWCF